MKNGSTPRHARRPLVVLGVAVAVAVGLIGIAVYLNSLVAIHEMEFPPAYTPGSLPATDPRLTDDDRVIGVEVHGVSRAYALSAFDDPDLHVVNDLVAGIPVTVTHCPKTGCSRVFSDPNGVRRLAVSVGGWVGRTGEESLLLRLGSNLYDQQTGEATHGDGAFPYPAVEHVVTTWGEWRRQHPTTLVYAGQ